VSVSRLKPGFSERKQAIYELAENIAPRRDAWIARNAYYYEEDCRYMRFLVPKGKRILDLGCGTGELLAALQPSYGAGVDFSPSMIDIARGKYPDLEFFVGDVEDAKTIAKLQGPFDTILLSDTIGCMEDCQASLANLHRVCTPETRIVIAYYSRLWEPILSVGGLLKLKMPTMLQNWLFTDDIANLLDLAGFEVIKREWRQLIPRRIFGLGMLINRYIAPWPGIRRLCLRNYMVARPAPNLARRPLSATVVIPCRNERGNIEAAVKRLPRFCDDIEIIFVEGHSEDGTLEEINKVIAAYANEDIKVVVQRGRGKGDAVREGFALARGDVLMILDADLTTPPEDMPKFYEALATGKGEFINGTRLVYPMDRGAMQYLNYIANNVFSWLFSWLLNQRVTDTLCGTKVLSKRNHRYIEENRLYFGDFDPFGDFDLIFGATKLNLKLVEIAVHYSARSYGETQIRRFRHGWLLLRMVVYGFRKFKAF
jgi:ubiquinone/menaquinone biosynthesis C-methylase UbiE